MNLRMLTLASLLMLPWFSVTALAEDRTELQRELDQARMQLAEAARKMAEIQRQLLVEPDADGPSVQVFRFESDQDQATQAPLDIEQIRHAAMQGIPILPPRLGVILGAAPDLGGLEVLGLTPGGRAEQAGFQIGDLLLAIDGLPVDPERPNSVRDILRSKRAGDEVSVTLMREDERVELAVEPATSREAMVMMMQPGPAPDGERWIEIERVLEGTGAADFTAPHRLAPRAAALGRNIDLVSNHPGLAAYFGTGDGVLVLRIDESNPLTLEAGDVIIRVDQQPVRRPVDIGRALIGREPGEMVQLEIMRHGVRIDLEHRIPERPQARPGIRPPRPPRPPSGGAY